MEEGCLRAATGRHLHRVCRARSGLASVLRGLGAGVPAGPLVAGVLQGVRKTLYFSASATLRKNLEGRVNRLRPGSFTQTQTHINSLRLF